MDDLKGHVCNPEAAKQLEDTAEQLGGGWNYRVCTFISKEGHPKIGIFEVYYNKERKPVMRAKEPELSWFIENCGEENTEESCKKAAKWELKSMLKAFRAPTLDAVKDFN
jgi:hypothetical protein